MSGHNSKGQVLGLAFTSNGKADGWPIRQRATGRCSELDSF